MNNKNFYIKIAIFQIVIYSSMILLSITHHVSNEYKLFVPPLALIFGIISLLYTAVLPIYFEKRIKVNITEMFTQEGNIHATYLTKKTIDSIYSGNKNWQKRFKKELKRLSIEYPEITDSAVRDQMCYYLDISLIKMNLPVTNLNDFDYDSI